MFCQLKFDKRIDDIPYTQKQLSQFFQKMGLSRFARFSSNLIYFQVCWEHLKLAFSALKIIDICQPVEKTTLAVMEHSFCRPSMCASIFQPCVLKTTGHRVNNAPGRIIEWERKRVSWESKSVKESKRKKGVVSRLLVVDWIINGDLSSKHNRSLYPLATHRCLN